VVRDTAARALAVRILYGPDPPARRRDRLSPARALSSTLGFMSGIDPEKLGETPPHEVGHVVAGCDERGNYGAGGAG
jgi:hypothetical protein